MKIALNFRVNVEFISQHLNSAATGKSSAEISPAEHFGCSQLVT